ncbi:MAG: AGE family epimerase/isomerase [Tannerellaceae bacterium]|nr:AGE family epimerase/isomerase [Tannerellaceae bacterium]
MQTKINKLKQEVQQELTTNILPYWIKKMPDPHNGGFYGCITGNETPIPTAEKGAILNARILWTFSAAYRLYQKAEYLQIAIRAKREIIDRFYDKEYGGIYWSLDATGHPLDTKKQTYAIAFAIYGLSEYHRATADEEAFQYALKLFHDIETHCFDKQKNGYYEAFTRQWDEIADMRLSAKDANERKTMNTHLHLLESYTNLYRVWKNKQLKHQLKNLIYLFIYEILDIDTKHLRLFFNDDWQSKHPIISYGHDIEASWLIHEAALVISDNQLLTEIEPYIIEIAEAATEGFLPGAGMIYELHTDTSSVDADRHWWVQAEAIVGYINLYQHFGDKPSLSRALQNWEFIKKHLIDHTNGEWYWSIRPDGTINPKENKAGFWKCPYHNTRMCTELIERFPL